MSDSELKIGKFVDENTGAMVATLSSLVEIPSVKGKSEDGCPFGREPARALEKMLSIANKMGFTTRNIDNYVGTIDFFSEGEPTLGILCHLDVVPEGSGWHTPPYSLTLSQGYLYARGVIDDKGPAVSVLYAMYALKKLGVKLTQNVRFIVGTDEENGSADLAYYKKKEKLPPRLFTPDGSYPIINLEKGMVRCGFEKEFASTGKKTVLSLSGGTVINAVPESCTAEVLGFEKSELEIAEKNAKTSAKFEYEKDGDKIKITCTGKSAHASQPTGG
ncbi:MAG: Sapep family Mn(2+)-dependent dipeptidase, partial [Clostridiales bacterium]|nr:Sapep family Mn(2+)-dependent dipeptidase [Clostridiales bacterium]